jgi:hypothetical protein
MSDALNVYIIMVHNSGCATLQCSPPQERYYMINSLVGLFESEIMCAVRNRYILSARCWHHGTPSREVRPRRYELVTIAKHDQKLRPRVYCDHGTDARFLSIQGIAEYSLPECRKCHFVSGMHLFNFRFQVLDFRVTLVNKPVLINGMVSQPTFDEIPVGEMGSIFW